MEPELRRILILCVLGFPRVVWRRPKVIDARYMIFVRFVGLVEAAAEDCLYKAKFEISSRGNLFCLTTSSALPISYSVSPQSMSQALPSPVAPLSSLSYGSETWWMSSWDRMLLGPKTSLLWQGACSMVMPLLFLSMWWPRQSQRLMLPSLHAWRLWRHMYSPSKNTLAIQKAWLHRSSEACKPYDKMAHLNEFNQMLAEFPPAYSGEQKIHINDFIKIVEYGIPQKWKAEMVRQSYVPTDHHLAEFMEFC